MGYDFDARKRQTKVHWGQALEDAATRHWDEAMNAPDGLVAGYIASWFIQVLEITCELHAGDPL